MLAGALALRRIGYSGLGRGRYSRLCVEPLRVGAPNTRLVRLFFSAEADRLLNR